LGQASVTDAVLKEIAATGVLRAGFNMGNALLVTGKTSEGWPIGVARDLAEAIAERLGVKLECVPYPRPNDVVNDADRNVWDICLVGADPARAEKIYFTSPYVEIKATYLVRGDSPLKAAEEADRPGKRIMVKAGAAYDLWLTRNLKHAKLDHAASNEEAFRRFLDEDFDALAGLEERLLIDQANLPGGKLLDGQFTSVQQATATHKRYTAASIFMQAFVEEAKASGLVAGFIRKHGVKGLSVAPPAQG
jgi:polar amino acid transport system substrate-binding protein